MQNTAYGLRISDWSSDVCSSDPIRAIEDRVRTLGIDCHYETRTAYTFARDQGMRSALHEEVDAAVEAGLPARFTRSEEHTSELQSLMRISYAVFCLKKKKRDMHYMN